MNKLEQIKELIQGIVDNSRRSLPPQPYAEYDGKQALKLLDEVIGDDAIYLVQELQIDPLENDYDYAFIYKTIGFVRSKAEWASNEIIKGTGYPIERGKSEPKYRLIEVKLIQQPSEE